MIRANVSIKDIDGFDAQLDEVMEAISANLDEVANVVLSAAKTSSAFRDKTGNLRISIKKRKSRYTDGGYIVKATGKNRDGDGGYHAANVEYGHVMIMMGRVTGRRVPAHPSMRPAKEKGIVKAIELFRNK